MNDVLAFALLFCAIACGWWLGRRSLSSGTTTSSSPPSQYYRGLNYLLDGRPDGAVDHFISALEVNSETLETHIALGNVLRRRGEVDRAIRIHENLLARPNLSRSQMHIAHLELARDYVSAGLLDRAEQLLKDLVEESDEQRDVARQHLLELYRSEREWGRAIEVGRELLPRKSLLRSTTVPLRSGQAVAVQLAHFYCELALEMKSRGDVPGARNMLQRALESDGACARASLELGRLEGEDGNHREAIAALTGIVDQDPDFLPEAIPALRACYAALGEEAELTTYLRECLDRYPSTPLMIAVAEDVLRDEGRDAAVAFLAARLAHVPSLRGLLRLIQLQTDADSAQLSQPVQPLAMLSLLLDRLIRERPAYRCEHCGFSAKHLLWFCPGCKYWGTFRTIRSTETE